MLSATAVDQMESSESSGFLPTDSDRTNGSSEKATPSIPTSIYEADPFDPLQVLLSVRLEEDFFDADDPHKIRIWCEWLRNIPPRN
jgi:hypothetical protein